MVATTDFDQERNRFFKDDTESEKIAQDKVDE